MSTEKTNKALKKRIKKTNNGKIKSRKAGGNHFNAKEDREKQYERNGNKHDPDLKKKDVDQRLPHE